MSASSPASVPPPPDDKTNEVFTLEISRFTLIDTAEDASVWCSRARSQWGGGKSIAIRVSCNSKVQGMSSPQKMNFSLSKKSWAGTEWDEKGIVVPLREDPIVLLEVVRVSKSSETVLGMGFLHTQAVIAESRQYAKFCVHILPSNSAIDATTVHAVADVEILSSLLDDRPESNFIPLEFNYNSVRVSTVDFFYPPFLISGSGQYIVSNIVCAMNMTESSSLAMQLVPLKGAENFIRTEPAKVITVRPQQRVYFCGTWNLSQKPDMRNMELQLTVNGSQKPSAPIIIKVHVGVPESLTSDMPYHYWVNTTMVSNRTMLMSQELPLIRTILPVQRVLGSGQIDQTEGMIVAFDKDKGEQVLVKANGLPVPMGGQQGAPTTTPSIDPSLVADLMNANFTFDSNASFVVRDRNASGTLSARGPLLNIFQKTCFCTIVLGTIRGFPMVYETTTGVSPSFQVSLTLLDQKGWQIVRGETLPSYQSASGSLRWTEELVLRKWPGALSTQFVRLNLTEVRARDGDETPIGSGLISLRSMKRTYVHSSLSVAFYVYETYSLYDQLNSPSLLMKDVNIVFSETI
ncbi:hypothetical protein AGDE_00005 [Angomonas deanei]|uniref:Uncharacterized protein n=1 Tax=Angomonas deanei TaxID=59799 RepID=S9WKR4_9TRYP|nr:hypothetical protein AGDE_04242 [Angomonas deanei]EPY43915.1 hypothetical protein AGDE_00005 [Angomonas deanei]CAD2220556.1 hypothetical protein, conserved [Angomonas deanei]|eukprot:EPY39686.1 hypothetical protein AGDE_04242 [Angomonas deanei]